MGREGRRLARQEVEEEEGCTGGPGEGTEQSRRAQQVRHAPAVARRAPSGTRGGAFLLFVLTSRCGVECIYFGSLIDY